MGGSLVRKIAAINAAAYGVNIYEQDVPGGVQGVGDTAVGMVALLPWGPENEITDIASGGEFYSNFAPAPFSGSYDDYPALKAILNKTFPGGLKVVRIAATGAAAATETFDDAVPGPSVDVTARYNGALGNQITIEWVNGTGGTDRSAIVRIGSTYEATYIDVVSGTTVTDPGDPYVSFAANASIANPPAVAGPTNLAGGDDGTAVAADYTGTSPAFDGIRAFYPSSVRIGALFVADPAEALKDSINDGLLQYAEDTKKGVVVLCTVDGQASSAAQTYVADYRQNDGFVVYPYPRCNTVNGYDTDGNEVEVDPSSFVAAAIVSVDPEVSPGGKAGAAALAGISSLEAEFEDSTYQALNAAGIAPLFMSRKLGAIIRNGVTTSLVSGKEKIFRRRMTDFITESIGEFLEPFVEAPLDIRLSPPTLGPITQQEIGAIVAFLEGLKTASRIEAYTVDPFGANVQNDINAGLWKIAVTVKLFSSQDKIVLLAAVGQSVTITEE